MTAGGQFFYAMEYLDGATLQTLVDTTGPMSSNRVVYVLKKVAASLVEAHSEGLLHRDIKPANIMLCKLGGVFDALKVLDFGLVQTLDAEASGAKESDDIRLEGTPGYLAPECIVDPSASSPQSDLYSLGAVGYFLLCGESPFDGESVVDVLAKHLTDSPTPPSVRLDHEVEPELEALVLSCLEKDPNHRPESAEALLRQLIEISARVPWTPSDRAIWWAEHEGVMQQATVSESSHSSAGRSGRRLRIGRGTYASSGA